MSNTKTATLALIVLLIGFIGGYHCRQDEVKRKALESLRYGSVYANGTEYRCKKTQTMTIGEWRDKYGKRTRY